MENDYYPFVNLPLGYDEDALEPFIDEKTMQLHHDRHLQTYINNLNDVLKDYPNLQKLSLEQLIRNSSRIQKRIRKRLKNNAGGVYNHRIFFDNLKKDSKDRPSGRLENAIDRKFGSFDKFKDDFKKAALSVFGSGYAWLVEDKGRLRIVTSRNQNSPIEKRQCPILVLDVWEHAYYLKHYNMRGEYVDDWFNVVNWDMAEKNFNKCMDKR